MFMKKKKKNNKKRKKRPKINKIKEFFKKARDLFLFDFGDIFKKNMEPPIKTIAQILQDLNAEKKGIWIPIDGYYALIEPHTEGVINYNYPTNGIILKAFLNRNTAEIRIFVAKFTDDPKREKL